MDAPSQPAIFFGTFPGNKKTNDSVTPGKTGNGKAEESMFWGDQVEFEDDNHESTHEVVEAKEEQIKIQVKEQPLGDRVKRVGIEIVSPTQVASSSTLNEELWPTLTSTTKSSEMQKVVSAAAKIREEERARAKAVEDERKKLMDVNKEIYRVDNARKDVNGRGKKVYGYRGMARRGREDYKIVAPTPVLKPEPEKLVATKEKPKHPLAAQLLGIGFVEKNADELDETKEKRKEKNDVKQDEKKVAEFARLQQEELEKRRMRNAKKMRKRAEKKLMEEERKEMEDEERKEMEDDERKEMEDDERKVDEERKEMEDKERKDMEDKERKVKAKRNTKKKTAKKNVKDDNIVAEVPPVSTLETILPPASLEPEPKANKNSVVSKDLPPSKKRTARSLVLVITSLATVISCIAFTDILF